MAANDEQETINILAHSAAAKQISRRLFMLGGMAVGASGLLAACGSGDSADAPEAGASQSSGPVESDLQMFTWGEYNSPKVIKNFESETGAKVTLSSYNSNEQLLSKLTAAKGTGGWDIIVPTGQYIPALAKAELIQPLDLDRITNFKNLETQYTDMPWDPGNKYSICKDWGTTGYVYDSSKISAEMTTWQDFLDVAQGEASGQVSVLDDPGDMCAIYFWANNINWMTTDQTDLDNCQDFMVNQLASHIKAFESYPGSNGIPQGTFWLSQAWNGDARLGMMDSKNDAWKWVFPGPATEIWMDTYVIPTGAKDINASYAWMNYLLEPDVSLKELEYIGYNTGVKGIEEKARKQGVEMLDLIFFTPEQVDTMQPGELNEAMATKVQIANETKAAAGG